MFLNAKAKEHQKIYLILSACLYLTSTWLQLSDIIRELHRLLPERRPGNQSQEKYPALHPQPEEEAQEEEDQVLPRVQAWRPVGEQRESDFLKVLYIHVLV